MTRPGPAYDPSRSAGAPVPGAGDPAGRVRSYGMGSSAHAGMQGSPAGQLPYVHLGQPGGASTPGAYAARTPEELAREVAAAQAAAAQFAAARSLQMPPEQKRRRKWPKVLLIIFIICCLVAAGVFAFLWMGGGKSARSGTAGQLEGKTEDEIQAELDRVVDEGMFNISIASTVQMADGSSPAELRIENVPGNRYLMRVTIVLDDTGQQIYATELIEPNFHIQQDLLDVDLDAGTYEATALFYAYDPDTEEQVGTAAAKIAIVVAA